MLKHKIRYIQGEYKILLLRGESHLGFHFSLSVEVVHSDFADEKRNIPISFDVMTT